MAGETIRIPIEARYSYQDGKAVLVSAVYADVPVAEIAKRILTYSQIGRAHV